HKRVRTWSLLWVTPTRSSLRLQREFPSLPMAPPSCPSPVLTSKSSDKSLRTSVVCVRMILTRARVSVTLASRSVARSERRVSKQWQPLKPQSAPQSVRTSPPDVAKHVLVATSASARPCVVPQRLHAWLSTAPPATCTSRSSTTWLATPWLQLPPWKLMCAHWKATRRLRHLRSAHSLLLVPRKPASKPSSSTAQATSTTVASQLLQTPLAKVV